MEKFNIPNEFLGKYREGTLTVEEAAMLCAICQASQSLDPSTQVGACLISADGEIVSTGFNQPPKGWPIDEFPFERNADEIGMENTKYNYINHAEFKCLNAARFSKEEMSKMTLVVTLFPCCHCAQRMIDSGIRKIIYLDDFYKETKDNQCSKFMLEKTGVEFIDFHEISDIVSCNINFDEKNKAEVRRRTKGGRI